MSIHQQVQLFYETIWNQHDISALADILHNDFSFRGSLGVQTQGHQGFIEYLDMIHNALGDYHCEIIDSVTEPPKVFTKMKFSGLHNGQIMGHTATGRKVSWEAAALFVFKENKIYSLWVLGDLIALEQQLRV